MATRRKRSKRYQVTWFDGRHRRLVQVNGERQLKRQLNTLSALPWVSQWEFQQVR